MSSSSFRRPDFRLHLGYPEVTLLRSDVPGMVRIAPPDHPAFVDDLRRLAGVIDASMGRLTVILPDREVWRDRRRLVARMPWARRREARELAARALCVPPGEVALSMGRRGDDGATALAATRRQTLVEVRRMLAGVGLRAEVIRGAGRFDGFTTPPALGAPRWSSTGRSLPPRLPRAAMAAGSLLATIAAVVALLGAESPEPVISSGPLVHQSVGRARIALAEAPPPAPAKAPPAMAVASAAPPPDRPLAVPPPMPAPAPIAAQPFSMSTRSLDLATARDGRVVLKLDQLPGTRAPLASAPAPLPRPRAARDGAAEAPQALRGERPLARPVAAAKAADEPVAEIVKRVAVAETEDFVRPEHRPEAAPSVRVASLTPADAVVGALAATAVAPLARPERADAAAAPKPVVKPAAPKPLPPRKTATAAPKLQRGAPPRAGGARPGAPPPPPAARARGPGAPSGPGAPPPGGGAPRPLAPTVALPVAKPVVVAVAPQPKIVPITPTPKVTRTARAAAATKTVPVAAVTPAPAKSVARSAPRLARGDLSLIGIFGDTDAPHALVRLPNGDIERVRAGDRVAGLQVAAVSSAGVRVRSGGSETTLRLPD